MNRGLPVAAAAALPLLAACADASLGPVVTEYAIAVSAGDGQLGEVGAPAPESIAVRVTDANTGDPVEGLVVSWRVIEGRGAAVASAASETDSAGIATARVQLGPDTGVYRVAAATNRLFGRHVTFSIRSILAPRVDAVEPAAAAVGDTVTITGERFAEEASQNTVLFGGVPGAVVSGGPTELRAVVPTCLPTRSIAVVVQRGAVASTSAALDVQGDSDEPVAMDVGAVRRFGAAELGCLRLAATAAEAAYMLVVQNAVPRPDREMPFRLAGLRGSTLMADAASPGADGSPSARSAPPPVAWEAKIREREGRIPAGALLDAEAGGVRPYGARPAAAPAIGDRDTFSVLDKDEEFVDVVAEVKYVSDHAVLYEDVDAPDAGFESHHFEDFGRLFDDPIYETDVGAFGTPSDVDGNSRVIVLFTPVVNALTERGRTDGFVGGFFYGYDLTDGEHSNRAEIFYSMVPDPDGRYSDERHVDDVLRVVPPVLAHELQHMIAFHQRRDRGGGQDELWLSEALAHMAEDLVADALLARADTVRGIGFKIDNLVRVHFYLRDLATTALIQDEGRGTLALRGGAWLFLKYAMGHHGGGDVLRALTQTAREGAQNVEAATGRPWAELLHRFTIAIWADDPAARAYSPIDPAFTFANMELRRDMQFWFDRVGADPATAFAFAPERLDYDDLLVSGALPSSSAGHILLRADTGPAPSLGLALTGKDGGAFVAEALPQLSVVRYR